MSDGWLKVVSGRLQFSRHETELPDGRPRRPSDEQLSGIVVSDPLMRDFYFSGSGAGRGVM